MKISSLAHTNTAVITVIASMIEDDVSLSEKRKCTAFHTFNYCSALYRQWALVCCV
jgi:hypothetical protein